MLFLVLMMNFVQKYLIWKMSPYTILSSIIVDFVAQQSGRIKICPCVQWPKTHSDVLHSAHQAIFRKGQFGALQESIMWAWKRRNHCIMLSASCFINDNYRQSWPWLASACNRTSLKSRHYIHCKNGSVCFCGSVPRCAISSSPHNPTGSLLNISANAWIISVDRTVTKMAVF